MQIVHEPMATSEVSRELRDLVARVHANATSNDRALLEEASEKLTHWRPAGDPADEDLAVDWLNVLDAVMSRLGTASDAGLYGRLFRRMRRLCSATERTPQALYVPDDIEIDRTSEVYQTKFSKVFKGRRGAEFVAVKVFDVHKDDKLRARKSFYKEAVTLRYVKHENVVPFYGVLEPCKERPVALVSRWMPNRDLFTYLAGHPDVRRLPFMVDTLSGLAYIHSLEIAHGDLKAQNVLIDVNPAVARLADFGFATSISNTLGTTGKSPGTPGFVAPEIIGASTAAQTASVPGDIYAFASLLYQIFELQRPFFNRPESEIRLRRKIMDGLRPEPRPKHPELTDTVWKVMHACWSHNSSTRPDLSQVMRGIKAEAQRSAV